MKTVGEFIQLLEEHYFESDNLAIRLKDGTIVSDFTAIKCVDDVKDNRGNLIKEPVLVLVESGNYEPIRG